MGREDVGDNLEDEGAAGEEDVHRATHMRTLPHFQGNQHHAGQHRVLHFGLHLDKQQAPRDQRIPTKRNTSITGTCAAHVDVTFPAGTLANRARTSHQMCSTTAVSQGQTRSNTWQRDGKCRRRASTRSSYQLIPNHIKHDMKGRLAVRVVIYVAC